MAGAGESSELILGSEPFYDFYCEICSESGHHLEAAGYCEDCKDYLCKTCFDSHKRTRLTIAHNVLGHKDMPRSNPLSHDKCSRIIYTKCADHGDKLVEYFCGEHESLGCATCVALKHRNCLDVENITEITEDFDQSQKFKAFENHLKRMTSMSTTANDKANENIRISEANCKYAVQSIKQWRDEVNNDLDEIENSFIQQVSATERDNKKAMDAVSETVTAVSSDLLEVSSKITRLRKTKKICELYIAMKRNLDKVNKIQHCLEDIDKANTITLCDFKPNRNKSEKLDSFGTLHFKQNDSAPQKLKNLRAFNMTSRLQQHIDLGSSLRSEKFWMTGLAVVTKSRVIAVDYGNSLISLVDLQFKCSIHDLRVKGQPWDVCAISATQAAVTVSAKHRIYLLKVTDTLTVDKVIPVGGMCSGISFCNDKLALTFVAPSKIQIMNLQGHVIKTLAKDRNGHQLFLQPYYACFSNDGHSIYVSDYGANKVVCVTTNGDILAEYSSRDLDGPEKVCADDQGNVYVVSTRNKTVHLLTPDCVKVKLLLTQKDGLVNAIYSLGHCPQTNRLIVGMRDECKMCVFQLSSPLYSERL